MVMVEKGGAVGARRGVLARAAPHRRRRAAASVAAAGDLRGQGGQVRRALGLVLPERVLAFDALPARAGERPLARVRLRGFRGGTAVSTCSVRESWEWACGGGWRTASCSLYVDGKRKRNFFASGSRMPCTQSSHRQRLWSRGMPWASQACSHALSTSLPKASTQPGCGQTKAWRSGVPFSCIASCRYRCFQLILPLSERTLDLTGQSSHRHGL